MYHPHVSLDIYILRNKHRVEWCYLRYKNIKCIIQPFVNITGQLLLFALFQDGRFSNNNNTSSTVEHGKFLIK